MARSASQGAARFLTASADVITLINRSVGALMGVVVIIMVINVFALVMMRYGFSFSRVWMQETYVWMHAAVFMLGAGYALAANAHVRIDVISRRYSPRGRAIMELAGVAFLATPFIWFIYTRSLPFVQRSWRIQEKSAEAGGLPALYLLKSVIVVFCVLMAIQLFASVLRSVAVLIDPTSEGRADKGEDSHGF